MLLFYKSGRLRVVIPTANFFDYDWRDIENVRLPVLFPGIPALLPASSRVLTH